MMFITSLIALVAIAHAQSSTMTIVMTAATPIVAAVVYKCDGKEVDALTFVKTVSDCVLKANPKCTPEGLGAGFASAASMEAKALTCDCLAVQASCSGTCEVIDAPTVDPTAAAAGIAACEKVCGEGAKVCSGEQAPAPAPATTKAAPSTATGDPSAGSIAMFSVPFAIFAILICA